VIETNGTRHPGPSVADLVSWTSGINAIAFLGTAVWENSLQPNNNSNPKKTAIIGLFFGAANYLGGLPAYWLSDKIGRSVLLAIGLPNMAWSMLVTSLYEMYVRHY
jgi:MFS family permease